MLRRLKKKNIKEVEKIDKRRKIVGIAAVMAVIVSLLVVSVPADKEEKENGCGCGCNSAPAERKPLNFNKVLEKTKGWEKDVVVLEKEIQEKREKLLELYKKAKDGVRWKEILDLNSELGKLETEYWYKREVLFEMETIRKYTELQGDGTLKIVGGSFPKVEDSDVDRALSAMEGVGEERMQKKLELYKVLFGEDFKEDMQNVEGRLELPDLDKNKVEKLYREMEDLRDARWNYEKKYIELAISRKMKKALSEEIERLPKYCMVYSNCSPPDTPLTEGEK
ncbi:MAG: hypothetical protein U9N35_07280, partial [Euryarchaeota archaeon]|nr:hypothetical protein [Euryarchaeota archaeon]